MGGWKLHLEVADFGRMTAHSGVIHVMFVQRKLPDNCWYLDLPTAIAPQTKSQPLAARKSHCGPSNLNPGIRRSHHTGTSGKTDPCQRSKALAKNEQAKTSDVYYL